MQNFPGLADAENKKKGNLVPGRYCGKHMDVIIKIFIWTILVNLSRHFLTKKT